MIQGLFAPSLNYYVSQAKYGYFTFIQKLEFLPGLELQICFMFHVAEMLNCSLSNSDNFHWKTKLYNLRNYTRWYCILVSCCQCKVVMGMFYVNLKKTRVSMSCVDCIISFYSWTPMLQHGITFTDNVPIRKISVNYFFSSFAQWWSTQKKSLKFMNNSSFIWCRYVSCNIYLLK